MNQKQQEKKQKKAYMKRNITGRLVMIALLGAWFACLFVESFLSPISITSPTFVHGMNWAWFSISWVTLTAILLAYGSLVPAAVRWFSLGASTLYCLRAAFLGQSYFLAFALCGVMVAMWLLCGVNLPTARKALGKRGAVIALTAVGLVGFGFLLWMMVSAYAAYLTPSAGSTGLYTQMLWHMSQTFGQSTSLEFGEVASHFAAHISPIFYIYLPFYALIPSPITLMVLQALAVCSAVIPLYLIARHRGLARGAAVAVGGLALLLPAVMGGTTEGLHELALLLPLLLWLLWALEKQRSVWVAVFALLCLCVRETAALYVFTVGLYWLLSHGSKADYDSAKEARRNRWVAVALMVVGLAYLIVALAILTYAGKGTLITRYENVTGVYNTSFRTLCWEIIMNPAVALYEMLTVSKLHFVMALLLPLGLLPLRGKRKAALVCIIPLLLINLLPDAAYQYNPDFPYGFGVAALALYLTVVALSECQAHTDMTRTAKQRLTAAVCFALIIGAFFVGDRYAADLTYAVTAGDEIAAMDEILEALPSDAAVSASGHLIPHLSDRTEIYRLDTEMYTDYVALDLREAHMVKGEDIYDVAYYRALGYTVVTEKDGVAAVLKKGS